MRRDDQEIQKQIQRTKRVLLVLLAIGCSAVLAFCLYKIPVPTLIFTGAVLVAYSVVAVISRTCPQCRKLFARRLVDVSDSKTVSEPVQARDVHGNVFSTTRRREVRIHTYRCKSCDHTWQRHR